MYFKIGIRNIFRNRRRSLATILAISLGAAALLNFGQFFAKIIVEFETSTVINFGHVSVFRRGYFDYGSGNPSQYGIEQYDQVIQLIENDPVLNPMIRVVTPTVQLFGVSGNFDLDRSRTFVGIGVVPSDNDRMKTWDFYGVRTDREPSRSGLVDDLSNRAVIGNGLARVLGFCGILEVEDCAASEEGHEGGTGSFTEQAPPVLEAIADLVAEETDGLQQIGEGEPRLDLLTATAGGAPNVVSVTVGDVKYQSVKAFDDTYIGLHFDLAQRLLYGRGEKKAGAIVLQLTDTSHVGAARERLGQLFGEHALDLEVRDLNELNPFYRQAVDFFFIIFAFIALIIAVIVTFTVVNTMTMAVMERTSEIGTSRALGLKRRAIRFQFLVEGVLIGVIGATVGVCLGWALATLINMSSISITLPGQGNPAPFSVLTSPAVYPLVLGIWVTLILLSMLAAVAPANHASRLQVVDALRHI